MANEIVGWQYMQNLTINFAAMIDVAKARANVKYMLKSASIDDRVELRETWL
jgi:hypothetical protein